MLAQRLGLLARQQAPVVLRRASLVPIRSYAKVGKPKYVDPSTLARKPGASTTKASPSAAQNAPKANAPIQAGAPSSGPSKSKAEIDEEISRKMSAEQSPEMKEFLEANVAGKDPEAQKSAESTPAEEGQAQIPLHDLTKGIPSTIDAELEEASRKDSGSSRAKTSSGGGKGTKEPPSGTYTTSAERTRNSAMRIVFGIFAGGLLGALVWSGRNWDTADEVDQHPEAPDGWSPMLIWQRIQARLSSNVEYYTEPTFTKLLPDLGNLDPNIARPYTLVLSLEDLLVHAEWTRENGWRFAKRPGVDFFLRYLSAYYEIVIWTSLPSTSGDMIIRKLDPYRIVMWPLFREATRYQDGQYIKDLNYLNRPLDKIIMIDTDPSHVSANPENAIVLPKWKGAPGDSGLVDLVPALEYLGFTATTDARGFLKAFSGKDIPTEFAKREVLMRELLDKRLGYDKQTRKTGISSIFGSMFGIKPEPMQMTGGITMSEKARNGNPLDQLREISRIQYEHMEKQIKENGEQWLKDMAEEEKKAMEAQMKNMQQGATSWLPSFK